VRILRAEVLAARGASDEARKLAEAERDRDATQVAPWLLLAALAEKPGGTKAALTVLDEAERRAGRRPEWPLARAQYWLRDGPDEAKKHLPKLLEGLAAFQGQERNRVLAGLAEVFVAADDLPTARQLWRRLADREQDDLGVRFVLFEAALGAREAEEAERLL